MNLNSSKDSRSSIIKATGIISLGTFSSRILGFIRDIVLASILGTHFKADAFFVAFRIPNLFRNLVGEGATNSAVIPVLSEYVGGKDKRKLWNFVSVIFIWAFMILFCLTILGMLFSPFLVRAIAPGFIASQDKLLLTIQLTRWMFPYLIFIGLTALCMGILYTLRSFVTPAFSPCLLNIAIIISAFIGYQLKQEPVYSLAIGVLIGGILQLVVQIGPLIKNGFQWSGPLLRSHPGVKKVGKLFLPRILGAGVYQLNVFIDTFCASLSHIVGAGGISAIYYASRIIQFPMGIFGIALTSALLPTLSNLATEKDMDSFKKTIIFSLKTIIFVMLPTSIIFIVLSTPLIRILFERGEFNIYSTQITSWTLLFYAMGLVSFGATKVMITALHSLQDTSTPVKVAGFCLVVNMMLNFILMGPLKTGGIALASSISATMSFLMLFYAFKKRVNGIRLNILLYLLKVSLASIVMGIIIIWLWTCFLFLGEVWRFICVVTIGGLVFLMICFALKVEQTIEMIRWIRSRKTATL